MKIHHLIFSVILGLSAPVHAQRDGGVPLLTLEEKEAIDAQSADFNRLITPTLDTAATSTVRVWSGTRRLAYGTVVADGRQILTKWSELIRARGDLRVEATGRELRAVELLGVYPDYDLALLAIDGEPLQPVRWADEELGLGRFLAAPQPDGRLAAFGIVAVISRNLRETDQAYLGVRGDQNHDGEGVLVIEVLKDSGADEAGIRVDDVIRTVEDRDVNGLFELRNALSTVEPGETLRIELERDGAPLIRDVLMGARPELPRFPGARLQQMDRMGGPISQLRDGFPAAIESDMRPLPNQVGGPVVDLTGNTVGITLARAGRTRTYIMPAAAVRAILETDPEDPDDMAANISTTDVQDRHNGIHAPRARLAPGGNAPPPDPERLSRHLSDMQRLLELMWEEMDALER